MHAELLRRSAQKVVDEEVERERKRKMEELEKMVKGEGAHEMEIAKTNENLTQVQNDLKNAFRMSSVSPSDHVMFTYTTSLRIRMNINNF